ncbi:DUF2142 domain-containing protein [Xylophilus sp.]|uniref:DUF2142 domain-containing protein n=1 Tax=Xylophilus sp. TaxID=2653893 RepID=UPI0013BE14AE|nr:DUF2142 domain-containing protein [Xylophilus sp.]KAF1046228.1 MAG: hypothetical protein GAK38_02625 [Xylophilus sp.]
MTVAALRWRAAGQRLLWVVALLGCWGISVRIPAFQSPDENAHLGRAYLISRGHLLLEHPAGQDSGGYFEPAFTEYLRLYLPLIGKPENKRLSEEDRQRAKSLRWSPPQTDRTFQAVGGTGYYLPLIYAPHALGLAVGQQLEMTVQHSYRLARAMNWLAVIGLLALACTILPPNPLAAALLLLPMSLFQAVSPVIDGISAALVVLAVALFLRGSDRAQAPPPRWHLWTLAATLLLLCTSRNQLLPMLGLPLFLAWRRRSWRAAGLGLVVILLVAAWTVYALKTTVDTRVPRDQGTGELLQHYAAHPLEFLRITEATVSNPAVWKSYTDTFIGVLGWLDTALSPEWYVWLTYGLGACAMASLSWKTLRRDAPERLWLLLTAAGSILLVFLAMLVTWTPHPTDHVAGVQGRYFVAPLLVAAAALSGTHDNWRPWWRAAPLVLLFAAASLSALLPALNARYH